MRGLSPDSCLPCLIYAYRIDSFCCPLEKRDKCQIYEDGKKTNDIFKDSDSVYYVLCVCVLSNKLALRRLLVAHSFIIFFFEECEN